MPPELETMLSDLLENNQQKELLAMLPKNPTSVMTRKEVEEFLTEATNKAVAELQKEREQKKQQEVLENAK